MLQREPEEVFQEKKVKNKKGVINNPSDYHSLLAIDYSPAALQFYKDTYPKVYQAEMNLIKRKGYIYKLKSRDK